MSRRAMQILLVLVVLTLAGQPSRADGPGQSPEPPAPGAAPAGSMPAVAATAPPKVASCLNFYLDPQSETFPANGGRGSFSVDMDVDCQMMPWVADPLDPWIHVTSGSGAGPGTVHYTVDSLPSTTPRAGAIHLQGEYEVDGFFTVYQNACTYTISPTSQSFPASGGSGFIAVSTDSECDWGANTGYKWIHLTQDSGRGSGTVQFTVDSNVSDNARSGTITAAGKTFTVTQAAPGAADFTWTPSSPAIGDTVTFTVSGGSATAWDFGEPSCEGDLPQVSCPGPSACVVKEWTYASAGTKTVTLFSTTGSTAHNLAVRNTGSCSTNCTAPADPHVREEEASHVCSPFLFALAGDQPQLAWDPVTAASRYNVQVFVNTTYCAGTADLSQSLLASQLPDPQHPALSFSLPLQPDDYCWRVSSETAGGTWTGSPLLATSTGCWTDCCCFRVTGQDSGCGDEVCDWWETAWDCPEDCGLRAFETGRTGGKTRVGFIPAAVGGQAGAGGTFWSTEGMVYNPNDGPADVVLWLTPDSLPGELIQAPPITLPPHGAWYADNLVQELWGRSDNGSLWFSSDVPVIVSTRAFNQGAGGTYGQGLGSVSSRLVLEAGDTAYLLGLSEDSQSRTNVILQATDEQAVVVRLSVFQGNGGQVGSVDLTVPAFSKVQRRLLNLGLGGFSSGFASVRVLSGGHLAALASVVDKVTGDAITVDAVLPAQVSSFGGASAAPDGVGVATTAQVHYLVPVVAHTPGRNGTFWVSTLWIQNPASTSQIVQLEYRPAGGGVYSAKATIGAKQQKTFDDLVSDFAGAGNGTGALHVYAPVGVIVNSHTFTHNQSGTGTYGQLAQGLAEGDLIGVNQVGVLQKLSSSGEYRCNVGFTEFSGEDTQVAVTLFTRSFTSLVPIASKQYTVPAYKNLQINQVFSDMGVTGDHTGAVAWVTVTSGGKVYAYASNVDNTTGDAEFIAARLQ